MPARLSAGPYDFVPVGTMQQAPWYVIPFDKHGRCTGPLTRDHLVTSIREGDFTDIYLFSHGWNNDWRDAVGDDPSGVATGLGYRGMIARYSQLRRDHNLTYDRPYRPLLVGVFWPSAWLAMPWEQAPEIAADDPALADVAVAQERRVLEELAVALDAADIEAFYALIQSDRLSEDEALALARMLLPFYRRAATTGPGDMALAEEVSTEQIVDVWRAVGQRAKPLDTGETGGLLGDVDVAPEIAGGLLGFDPRMIVRTASVYLMKDRAGAVGSRGVADLLTAILNASSTPRVHVIGHSYGCRVLLSAICHPPQLPREITSALLIQPAISHLCFAMDVQGTGRPGGYRSALKRIDQPIMLTFSRQDLALHDAFHFALVRPSDLGEAQIAGDDEPPNAYAALGGYGPRGCAPGECELIPIKQVGDPYDLGASAPRIYALNSTDVITGHSDFDREATWWALYNQVRR